MNRVPVTVITGFLGAGKTTLLRGLLTRANGRRIAVIVNEFGDAGFDGALVEECATQACAPGDIVELTNGCICCTVAEDFVLAPLREELCVYRQLSTAAQGLQRLSRGSSPARTGWTRT